MYCMQQHNTKAFQRFHQIFYLGRISEEAKINREASALILIFDGRQVIACDNG